MLNSNGTISMIFTSFIRLAFIMNVKKSQNLLISKLLWLDFTCPYSVHIQLNFSWLERASLNILFKSTTNDSKKSIKFLIGDKREQK